VDKCGAIKGFARKTKFKIASLMNKRLAVQLLEKRGDDIFMDEMTQHVFYLTKNYQVKDKKFRALLNNLQTGEVTENDARKLMILHFFNYLKEKKDTTENDPRTIWLFTKNETIRLKTRRR